MKKILITLSLAAIVSSSQAQGLINFFNSASTLVTLSSNAVNLGSTPGTLGQFRYELFVAPAGTLTPASFTGTGVIGTNQAAAGRFTGGANVGVPLNPAGSTRAIMVRGWSSNLGSTWAAAKLNEGVIGGFFGESAIAPSFILGGFDGVGTLPTLPAFSGTAISTGFALTYVPSIIPEPSSMALAGLGAASLLIFRRRK